MARATAVAEAPPSTKSAPRRARTIKSVPLPAPPAVEPESEAPAEVPVEVRVIRGLKVVKDESLPSNLPPVDGHVYPLKIRVLTLEDDSVVYGCADCEEFAETAGEIRKHRARVHGGAPLGRKRAAPVLSADAAEMTLGELLELAQGASTWGRVVENLTDQMTQWKDRATKAEMLNRRYIGAFDRLGFVLKDGE